MIDWNLLIFITSLLFMSVIIIDKIYQYKITKNKELNDKIKYDTFIEAFRQQRLHKNKEHDKIIVKYDNVVSMADFKRKRNK